MQLHHALVSLLLFNQTLFVLLMSLILFSLLLSLLERKNRCGKEKGGVQSGCTLLNLPLHLEFIL